LGSALAESLARGGTGGEEQNMGYQSQMRYRLVIGNKNISSWSLRPWLAMRQAGIPFEEIKIELRRPDTPANIGRYSPSGRVPALLAGDLAISESLAILEYLAEVHPDARLWPAPQPTRALARAVSAEMHAGFAALREHCPMDFVARLPMATLPDAVAAEVRRILALWRDCRRRHGGNGPFLFGAFSAADAMYAPIAARFRTYLPDLMPYGDDGTAAAYSAALFALPGMLAWEEAARLETANGAPLAGNLAKVRTADH
jgi:glutathione S-transferase